MKVNFPGNTYVTPAGTRRPLFHKLLCGSRWYFYTRFMRIILKYRRLALKKRYYNETWVENSYAFFKAIEESGGRFHIKGIDNLRQQQEEPVVIISNHMSTLETLTFPCIIDNIRRITFVVKEFLIKSTVFGPIMRARAPVVVSRENSRKDLLTVYEKGEEMINNGYSIVIFPQATRSAYFNPKEFNSLGIKLASRAGVRVIPVAIKTDFWGNGKWVKEFGPISPDKDIHMAFGEPMTVRGNQKQAHKKIIEFIQAHLEEWGGQIAK